MDAITKKWNLNGSRLWWANSRNSKRWIKRGLNPVINEFYGVSGYKHKPRYRSPEILGKPTVQGAYGCEEKDGARLLLV